MGFGLGATRMTRYGMRKSGLSQKAVSAILKGEPVRPATLATFQLAMKA
jgi:hypothetical protein